MTVTVLPILEPDSLKTAPLAKVMNERLQRLAVELQDTHLKKLHSVEPLSEDIVIYIGYTGKYNVRWRIVNDVAPEIEIEVARKCADLGYVLWKTNTIFSKSDPSR
ncbi:hypothetical protein [Pedobacter sp.]|jgi:hypothetical protein|uniref:hypothetical protein n=1 Tax=Pedobacter sp. TaxID=1411316 RepID=UPI002C65D732|nr:hypothetical protein [Pedobacter sp.]HWW41265.1 hypothetical protein [Pedobacter sp.]